MAKNIDPIKHKIVKLMKHMNLNMYPAVITKHVQ